MRAGISVVTPCKLLEGPLHVFLRQFQDGCRSTKQMHHSFIHPTVNHSYIQLLIPRKQTNENTTENVSSTLLRDFVSEVPTILDRITGTANPHSPLHVNKRRSRAKAKTGHFPIPDFFGGGGGGINFPF